MPDGEFPLHTPADGIPVAPSLEPTLGTVQAPPEYAAVDSRVIVISAIAIAVGAAGALIANLLTHLIGFITNLAYFGRLSGEFSAPSTARWGVWSVLVPIVGALI
ncbi:MAG TPA: chloride channel protein, partial [Casimicrobiaceae bacterium]|nr:chloride channel protein [Casimicrobiaceae bacterium]